MLRTSNRASVSVFSSTLNRSRCFIHFSMLQRSSVCLHLSDQRFLGQAIDMLLSTLTSGGGAESTQLSLSPSDGASARSIMTQLTRMWESLCKDVYENLPELQTKHDPTKTLKDHLRDLKANNRKIPGFFVDLLEESPILLDMWPIIQLIQACFQFDGSIADCEKALQSLAVDSLRLHPDVVKILRTFVALRRPLSFFVSLLAIYCNETRRVFIIIEWRVLSARGVCPHWQALLKTLHSSYSDQIIHRSNSSPPSLNCCNGSAESARRTQLRTRCCNVCPI